MLGLVPPARAADDYRVSLHAPDLIRQFEDGESLNVAYFEVGRSWCTCIRVCLNAASLFARDGVENGEEQRSSSASVDTLQTAIH
jgi:hypothetical protein